MCVRLYLFAILHVHVTALINNLNIKMKEQQACVYFVQRARKNDTDEY